MIEFVYLALGFLAIALVVFGVAVLNLWAKVERLSNPYSKARATVVPKRVPVMPKGKR